MHKPTQYCYRDEFQVTDPALYSCFHRAHPNRISGPSILITQKLLEFELPRNPIFWNYGSICYHTLLCANRCPICVGCVPKIQLPLYDQQTNRIQKRVRCIEKINTCSVRVCTCSVKELHVQCMHV